MGSAKSLYPNFSTKYGLGRANRASKNLLALPIVSMKGFALSSSVFQRVVYLYSFLTGTVGQDLL